MVAAGELKVVFTSLDPADAVRGGLISDVDVMVKDIVWTKETPVGYTSREPNYFIKGYLELIEDPNVVEEVWWSAGSMKAHTPCDDNGEPVEESYRLTGGPLMQGSNAVTFLDSLKACGFPTDKLKSANLKELVGLEMHVIRKVIEREGLQRAPRDDGRSPAGTVVCQKIIRVPGEKRAAKAKPAAASAAAQAAAASKPAAAVKPAAATTAATTTATAATTAKPAGTPAVSTAVSTAVNIEELAALVLTGMMPTNGDVLPVADARLQANRILFSQHKLGLSDRNKVIETMLDPAWLEGQGVLVEGETLVLAP
jgi:hypothetical protein